ncbi:hypothetical protein ACP4OV_013276 [Aristida adscensionis]
MPSANPPPPAGGYPSAQSSSAPESKKILMTYLSSYSECKNLANGSSIKSKRFDLGGRSWYIVFFPNGMRPGTTESISLYLQLAGDDDAGDDDDGDVEVRYKFILPRSGECGGLGYISGEVSCAVSRRQNAHGFERFVTREELERSDCIREEDGRFCIRYDLTVVGRHRESSAEAAVEPSCGARRDGAAARV